MSGAIENLLTRLEDISGEAVRVTDPALKDQNAGQGAELICERGLLIEELTQALAAAADRLGYSEWNRLVVIHHQGTRVHENLQARRNEIALDLMANTRGRAFLDCVTAVEAGPHSPRIFSSE